MHSFIGLSSLSNPGLALLWIHLAMLSWGVLKIAILVNHLTSNSSLITILPSTQALLDTYGIGWKSYTEQYLDSTGMFRDAVIAILATIARQEHARLSERVVAGLRRAKREGKVLGRKRIILDRHKVRELHASGSSVRAIAAQLGVSKSLVANITREQY
jgi:Resolvase, N terminal domain